MDPVAGYFNQLLADEAAKTEAERRAEDEVSRGKLVAELDRLVRLSGNEDVGWMLERLAALAEVEHQAAIDLGNTVEERTHALHRYHFGRRLVAWIEVEKAQIESRLRAKEV